MTWPAAWVVCPLPGERKRSPVLSVEEAAHTIYYYLLWLPHTGDALRFPVKVKLSAGDISRSDPEGVGDSRKVFGSSWRERTRQGGTHTHFFINLGVAVLSGQCVPFKDVDLRGMKWVYLQMHAEQPRHLWSLFAVLERSISGQLALLTN